MCKILAGKVSQCRVIHNYFSVSSKPLQMDGLVIWNEGLEPFDRDPFFKITKLRIVGPNNEEVIIVV